jgi:hypothetical protein
MGSEEEEEEEEGGYDDDDHGLLAWHGAGKWNASLFGAWIVLCRARCFGQAVTQCQN